MRLLLVGPPGAGKGTQARLLASHYGVAHLSSGDILRKEVAAGSTLGRAVADHLARGDLVPDELVLQGLTAPVIEAAANGGFVLDGFPRTLRQAEAAYEIAKRQPGVELQAVVHLEVERQELLRRLSRRASQDARNDDRLAIIEHRLELYDSETRPMLEFYAERGIVVDVNGDQPVEAVFSDIVSGADVLSSNLR